jgi:CRISPR/Cas system-associated exonuclease Cas4 (RecB family)
VKEWEVTAYIPTVNIGMIPISYSSYWDYSQCPLRFSLSKDKAIPRKIHPKARMGSCFHAIIPKIYQPNSELKTIFEEFHAEIKKQRADSLKNYREQNLVWSKEFREQLEIVIAVLYSLKNTSDKHIDSKPQIESTLVSKDKLLIGRPDAIYNTIKGSIVIDYKTSTFNEEKIHQYENQILFYSGLWQELHGTYPILGRVSFLVNEHIHEFKVDAKKCQILLKDARTIATEIQSNRLSLKSKSGDHCSNCEYRPWCIDYWSEVNSSSDFQGEICVEHPSDSKSFCLKTKTSHIKIVNKSNIPNNNCKPGILVRMLDLISDDSIYIKGNNSEMFIVSSS